MLDLLREQLANYIRANIVAYFFIILIFVIGIVFGALAVKIMPGEQKTELLGYLKVLFQGLSQKPESIAGTGIILLDVIFNNAKVICLMWFLGFTIVGVPFVLFMVWMRGFVIGFTVGFLVDEYVMKGLVFAIVSVLPHNFLAVPAVLATGVAAVTFSLMLVRRSSKPQAKKNSLFYSSIAYSFLCLLMLMVTVLAAMVEVYVSPVFMKLVAGIF